MANPRDLLNWYDAQARVMPWRVGPAARKAGQRPDPYRVWLSEIMLQQTTVAAVRTYFLTFTARWPNVTALADARDDDVMAAWAGLGYYARARNLLKCARLLRDDLGGQFPQTEAALQSLPGIGPYTSAAIAAIAFDVPATVLDGNVERVMARLFAVEAPLPGAKEMLRGHAKSLTPDHRPGDYAQAVMDLGATICTPRNPACGICPWSEPCKARAAGIAADLPRKSPKPAKPVRHGTAYFAQSPDGSVLLERRPDKGLLGGMMGLPGSPWSVAEPPTTPPFTADWSHVGEVRHTFTHFHLILQVMAAETAKTAGAFYPADQVSHSDLPTVMRKAYLLGQAALQ